MKRLFEPVNLGKLSLKNRLVRSATWEGIAAPDGSIAEDTYEIYDELASGGVGAVITGFTSVMAQDCCFSGMMRLCSDDLICQYKKLTNIIHQKDCPVIAQLALGAYYRPGSGKTSFQIEPDEMTNDEIKEVINAFVSAAIRADQAGYDGVQIHAAHFFFLSRFISPAVNHRQDAYGGSTERRSRILTEILSKIKKAVPDLHVTAKINCCDFIPGGLGEEESLVICKILEQAGIDSIEISGNGTSVAGIKAHVNEGYFVPFAARAAQELSCPVMVVGGFRSAETMQKVLDETEIVIISLSRPLLCEPDWPKVLQNDWLHDSQCVSCNRCYSSSQHSCVFRGRQLI